MIALIALAAICAIVWMLWAPAMAFNRGFASLLERPVGRSGLWAFLAGVETIGGEYRGRPVLFVLHHRRSRYTLGYLVVAMQATSSPTDAAPGVFRELVRSPAAREAWDDLELAHELRLSLADGWMRARWQPIGLRLFPGPFDPDRWRSVLESMLVVVASLEGGAVAPATPLLD